MSYQDDYDWIDGRKVPQLFVEEDYTLTGVHRGTVHVESGRFILAGELRGTLNIKPKVIAEIRGTQKGTVTVGHAATVIVAGAIHGSTVVDDGATLIIEADGKLAGSLTNFGKVIVRGVFGGSQTGSGVLSVEGQGYIKQPKRRDRKSVV